MEILKKLNVSDNRPGSFTKISNFELMNILDLTQNV